MNIKLTESQISILREHSELQNNITEEQFNKEVKLFLYNLISNDSHSQIPSNFWQMLGYKKHEVINLLNRFGLITRVENQELKVPKANFERKLGRLYSYMFPDNQQTIVEEGEGGGDMGGGVDAGGTNSCSSVGGSYEIPFTAPLRRKIGSL